MAEDSSDEALAALMLLGPPKPIPPSLSAVTPAATLLVPWNDDGAPNTHSGDHNDRRHGVASDEHGADEPRDGLDPARPVKGAGEVLLASWTNKGVDFYIFDSFGRAPFHVANNNGKEYYATRGIVMRIAHEGCTVVIRTNSPSQYQAWVLGDERPLEWRQSLFYACKNLERLPPMLAKKLQASSTTQFVFSLFQNHVSMGTYFSGTGGKMGTSLRYTAEGERLKPAARDPPPRTISAKKAKRLAELKRPRGEAGMLGDDEDLPPPPMALHAGVVHAVSRPEPVAPVTISPFFVEAPLLDPARPVPGAGETLLASWVNREFQLHVFDSYGTDPFLVTVINGKQHYATCNSVMRVSHGNITVVVRTSADARFQAWRLGEERPVDEWFPSVDRACKRLDGLSRPLAKSLQWTAPKFLYSLFQNHVCLDVPIRRGGPVGALLDSLRFTPDGERLKPTRAAAPAAPPEAKKAKAPWDDDGDDAGGVGEYI